MDVPRILFFGNDASRSGAPLLLLRFLRWARENTDWEIAVALWGGGALEREYAAIARTINLGCKPWGFVRRRPLLRRTGMHAVSRRVSRARLRRLFKGGVPDLIYVNTLPAAALVETLGLRGTPVVCHVHELETSIRFAIDRKLWPGVFGGIDRFIACSEAVAENLVRNHGVERGAIDV